ncbi:MAG TPA: phage holin family protein [Candidatus Binatia bacterium]|nr:phage holin family protein [Candidatus Binatia bacterium]
MNPGSATPAGQPLAGDPPGFRAQLGATLGAGKRLLRAHIDLAKAEASEIAGNVGRVVGLVVVGLVFAFIAGLLLVIGGLLFLGEWLFGSIGWGVLLGFLLLLDVALVTILAALDVSGRRIGASFGIAAVIGIAVGLLLGFDILHQGWRALGDAVAQPVVADEGWRTALTAMVVVGLIAGVLGLVGALRGGSGASGAIAAFVGLAILGALLGWITSITISAQVGAALGVLVALIAWPVLAGRDVMGQGIDGEALKDKFMPNETINLTKETIEWVRARTPLVPKS